MPIKRYIFVMFLTVSYLINTFLVSFEDLGFFLSTKKNARDASALNCLRAAPIAQKFSPERKLKVFLSKKTSISSIYCAMASRKREILQNEEKKF